MASQLSRWVRPVRIAIPSRHHTPSGGRPSRTMRMSFRLIFSLVVGVTLLSFAFAAFQVRAQKRSLRGELENRAAILAESLEGKVTPLLQVPSHKRLQALARQFGNREHMLGIAVFDSSSKVLAATPGLDSLVKEGLTIISGAMASDVPYAGFRTANGKATHLYVLPLHDDSGEVGALAVFHDAGFIRSQTTRVWGDTFLTILIQAVFIALATLLIVHWTILGPVARTTKWIREVRTGKNAERPGLSEAELFEPLAKEVTDLAKSLNAARAAAEEEARLRENAEVLWTPERLRVHVRSKLGDRPFFLVSNREP